MPGLSAHVELIVAEGDTAVAMRSGDVHVLSTPRVIGPVSYTHLTLPTILRV